MTNESAGQPERLWNVKDVADYIGCSQSYVYKAAERGELPHLPIGAMIRFEPQEVREFVRRARERHDSRVAKKGAKGLFSEPMVSYTSPRTEQREAEVNG